MTAGANQDRVLTRELIDEQPIAAKVALAITFEVSNEWVIAIIGWQRFPVCEQIKDFTEPIHVATAALHPLNVFAELFLEKELAHQIPSAALASLALR